MNSYKYKFIICYILICIVVISMMGATYAYFTLKVVGEGSNTALTAFNGVMEITYTDTSNVSLVNAYTGESIIKTFTVENTGDSTVYYNINLEELVNNFANPDDLVYTLSETGGNVDIPKTPVPTISNTPIASNIRINAGITHSYVMTITFLKTEEDQSNNMNKTFSSRINVLPSNLNNFSYIYRTNTLPYNILKNNVINKESTIDYTSTASTDGLYYTNNSISGSTSYFFRGSSNINNNVLFAGYCWKIIRTTEDLGTRLIFNGVPTSNTCLNISDSTAFIDTLSVYNNSTNYNAYVGYMYGNANSSNYTLENADTNSSAIKTVLDNWYTSNLSKYSDYISDSYYCNNRKMSKFKIGNVLYGLNGYGNNNTGYISYNNISNSTTKPSYNCLNKNDIFTVSNNNGNKSLTNPIGLITADELVFAGYTKSTAVTTNYLYNSSEYWTMTPAYFNGSISYNYTAGQGYLRVKSVSTSYGVRPVITINQNAEVISGDGSNASPYKITE